jgi:hypothetical protein
MINVRRRDEAAFLRALPAIRLLRQPMSLDGFPNGRFVPRATWLLRFVLSRALRSTSGSQIDAEDGHANCLLERSIAFVVGGRLADSDRHRPSQLMLPRATRGAANEAVVANIACAAATSLGTCSSIGCEQCCGLRGGLLCARD